MNHHEAFLAEIIAHPEEDAPRLIFADWLDEHGEESRGEFIRVQCVLARDFDQYEQAPRAEPLRRRERELLESHKNAWLPLPSNNNVRNNRAGFLDGGDQGEFTFRRGFVESIICTAAAWLKHAGALTAAAPIREVRLTTWPAIENIPYGVSRLISAVAPAFHEHRLVRVPSNKQVAVVRIEGSLDTGRATRELLAAEWPRITFHLPEYGQSRGAYPAWRAGV